VIDPATKGAWRDLEGKLRPFIARRVPAEIEVDDVLQDVFLRMQRSLASLRDDQRFGAWVYRIARSSIVDHLRASARWPAGGEFVDDATAEADDGDGNDDDRDVERELAGYLGAFVATLPSPYREALTLTELEGLTQKQAAEMTGVSLSGMKSRVQRGRRKLRAALEDCCTIALDARRRVIACAPRPDGKVPDGCCE
jgi:RNA polymerase sigma-70 factor (ECF subfamily)